MPAVTGSKQPRFRTIDGPCCRSAARSFLILPQLAVIPSSGKGSRSIGCPATVRPRSSSALNSAPSRMATFGGRHEQDHRHHRSKPSGESSEQAVEDRPAAGMIQGVRLRCLMTESGISGINPPGQRQKQHSSQMRRCINIRPGLLAVTRTAARQTMRELQ